MADADLGSRHAPEPFRADLEPHRETIVIVARGEIDLDSVSHLDDRFREVVDAGFKRVVLDLREVSFMDSTGLRSILAMNMASRDATISFEIVRGPHAVARVFELTSTEHMVTFISPHEVDASPT
jgi:anti-anti-sigma factor